MKNEQQIKEKKEKIKKLVAQYRKLSPEDAHAIEAKALAVSVEGHTYSMFNQCLIAFQNGQAGVYGGFGQWRSKGRMIKKGEHGFTICRPIGTKDKNKESNEEMTEDELITRFAWITVFHENQTTELLTTCHECDEKMVEMVDTDEGKMGLCKSHYDIFISKQVS